MEDTRTDPADEVLASSPEGLVWALWIAAAATSDSWGFPWPLFMTLGWGVGLAFNAWHLQSS